MKFCFGVGQLSDQLPLDPIFWLGLFGYQTPRLILLIFFTVKLVW